MPSGERETWKKALQKVSSMSQFVCITGNQLYYCPMGIEACPGSKWNGTRGSNSQCGVGYSGPLCSVCRPGYYKSSTNRCTECGKPAGLVSVVNQAAVITFVIVVVGSLLAWYLMYKKKARKRHKRAEEAQLQNELRATGLQVKYSDFASSGGIWVSMVHVFKPEKVKLLISYCQVETCFPLFTIVEPFSPQVLVSFDDIYPRVWPEAAAKLLRGLAVFNSDLVSFLYFCERFTPPVCFQSSRLFILLTCS
jgi:hypothetical protein